MINLLFKRIVLLALLAAPLAVLSGCNTIEGVGEDTEALGESIQSGAEERD